MDGLAAETARIRIHKPRSRNLPRLEKVTRANTGQRVGAFRSITPTVGRRMSGPLARSPRLQARTAVHGKAGFDLLEVQIDGALHHLKDRFGLNALFPHPRLTLMRFPCGAFDGQTDGDVHRSTCVSPRTEVIRRGRAIRQGQQAIGRPPLAGLCIRPVVVVKRGPAEQVMRRTGDDEAG